jgi:hypothetical protein
MYPTRFEFPMVLHVKEAFVTSESKAMTAVASPEHTDCIVSVLTIWAVGLTFTI